MSVRFKNPMLQDLAENLLQGKDLDLLMVNRGTPSATMLPMSRQYYDHLEAMIISREKEIQNLKKLKTLADVALVTEGTLEGIIEEYY